MPYAANDEKKETYWRKKEAYFTAGHINGSIKRFRDISKQDLGGVYLHLDSFEANRSGWFLHDFFLWLFLQPRANGRNIVGNHFSTLSDVTFFNPAVCTPCCMLLGVFAQSLNPVKLLATCKRPNNVGSCCVRLHVACPFVGWIVFILNTRTGEQSNQKKPYSRMFCRLCPLIHDRYRV